MPNPTFLGYLYDPYLQDPYMGDTGIHSFGMQVNLIILSEKEIGAQVARQIVDYEDANGMQIDREISGSFELGLQVQAICSGSKATGMQIQGFINTEKDFGFEVRMDKTFPHLLCDDAGYLAEDYLTEPYLHRSYCVHGPMQIMRTIANFPKEIGTQVSRTINSEKDVGAQIKRVIESSLASGLQVSMIRSFNNGMQTTVVLYNTTNLRVMLDFPSRGISGVNWTATSTEAGDFDVNNVNTDIVEQRWQSASGNTSAVLRCDTEISQGIAVDTFAMLGHNLTTSATITVEASNDAGFGPVEFSFAPTVTVTDLYYIAPTFPTQQFRYWRIIISDPTNSQNCLKVGTIVFGTTIILQGECFIDEVPRTLRHFADKIATEAFTNVSNDRALKRAISLEFRNIIYNRGNWKNLKRVVETARTSLKALWIPDPQKTDRFSVFAKISQMPQEHHKNMGPGNADTVNFTIDLDESL